MSIIKTESLEKIYYSCANGQEKKGAETRALKGVNFFAKEGDFIAIMGKSGCGKTTLLKILGLIEKPTAGELYIKEKNIKEMSEDEMALIRRNQIGFVFQDYYLMDSLSVEDNIMVPMILNNVPKKTMINKVHQLAKQFNIEELLRKKPYELSGGEKQRVAISRALVNEPDLVLADEPTGNLDSESSSIVIKLMQMINTHYKKTVIIVTHDPQIASICKMVVFLKDGILSKKLERGGRSSEEFLQEIKRV